MCVCCLAPVAGWERERRERRRKLPPRGQKDFLLTPSSSSRDRVQVHITHHLHHHHQPSRSRAQEGHVVLVVNHPPYTYSLQCTTCNHPSPHAFHPPMYTASLRPPPPLRRSVPPARRRLHVTGVTAASSGTHTRWCTSTGVSPVRSHARPSAGYGSYRRGAEEIPAGVSVTSCT